MQNESLLEQVGPERRKKVIRYLQPDDRKRSLGAGIMIRKILNGNGLSESSLKYSENGKPLADHFHFNISHAGEYVVGVVSDGEVGCDIERNVNAPLEIAEHYFHSTEREYIEAASDPGKAFFYTLDLKGKLYENDRQGDEPSA
ncbi:MAG: 4'-phosphopantetheinyl transferase family protein [Blautia faecis]